MNINELLEIVKVELKDLSSVSNPDFRIEQVEPKHAGTVWDLVVSYFVENKNKRVGPSPPTNPELKYERVFKKVSLDENKKVTGIFIYNNK